MIRLWCWARVNAPEGRIAGRSPGRLVEGAVGWTGEAGAFVTAAAEVGFLDRDGDDGRREARRTTGMDEAVRRIAGAGAVAFALTAGVRAKFEALRTRMSPNAWRAARHGITRRWRRSRFSDTRGRWEIASAAISKMRGGSRSP